MILIIISKRPENIREGAHFQQNRRPCKPATSLKNEHPDRYPPRTLHTIKTTHPVFHSIHLKMKRTYPALTGLPI